MVAHNILSAPSKDEAPWVKSQPSYRETLCRETETETGGREKGNNIFLLNFKITL